MIKNMNIFNNIKDKIFIISIISIIFCLLLFFLGVIFIEKDNKIEPKKTEPIQEQTKSGGRTTSLIWDDQEGNGVLSGNGTTTGNFVIGGNFTASGTVKYIVDDIQTIATTTQINANNTIIRIVSSGGPVNLGATPQIATGTDGQILTIIGTSDSNMVTLEDTNGLALCGGVSFTLGNNDNISFIYLGSEWLERGGRCDLN